MNKDKIEKRLNKMVAHIEEYKGRIGFKHAKDLGKPLEKRKGGKKC